MKTLTRDDTVHDVGYVLASEAHAVEEERDELRRDIAALLNALPNGAHDVTEGVGTIQAMRDVINEAHEALKAWPRAGSGMSTDFMAQSLAFRTGQAALAKLKPFATP